MGIYERDYMNRSSRPTYSRWQASGWALTKWLIATNVAIFLLDRFLEIAGVAYQLGPTTVGPLVAWGHFSTSTALTQLQLWRFLTFQFLHANLMHLIFNMFGLYVFGRMIESFLGPRRYLTFYLLCGSMGAISYLLFWWLGVLVSAPWIPLVGASAGIFGVLIAGASIAPNATVLLLIPPIPIRLRTLAWVLIGIGLFTILSRGSNSGGEAAHLGGAALGYLLIRKPHLLSFADVGRSRSGRDRRP